MNHAMEKTWFRSVPVVTAASTWRSPLRLTARVPAMKVSPAPSTTMVPTWSRFRLTRMKLVQALSTAIHIALDVTVAPIPTSKDALRLRRNNGDWSHVNR